MNEELAPPAGGDDEGYVPVSGVDRAATAYKRWWEYQVERKVTRDHQHIVAAYGVIWSLFVIYGLFLWWKAARLRSDLEAMERQSRGP